MKLIDLKNLKALNVDFKEISKESGINYFALAKRIERNSPELTEEEAKKIANSLKKRKKNIKKSLGLFCQTLDKV